MVGGAKEVKGALRYKLIAYEPEGAFTPNHVTLIKPATVGTRNDFFWAEWSEPSETGELLTQSGTLLLLATRHHGYSLADLSALPIHVYVCGVKDPKLNFQESLRPEDVSILAWALMLAPGDETENLSDILQSMDKNVGNVFNVNPVKQ